MDTSIQFPTAAESLEKSQANKQANIDTCLAAIAKAIEARAALGFQKADVFMKPGDCLHPNEVESRVRELGYLVKYNEPYTTGWYYRSCPERGWPMFTVKWPAEAANLEPSKVPEIPSTSKFTQPPAPVPQGDGIIARFERWVDKIGFG